MTSITRAAQAGDSGGLSVREPRVAVVTGAGGGIGRSVALALLGAGYAVALIGRTQATLQETVAAAARVDHAGPSVALACDVTDEGQVAAAFGAAVAQWGCIDLLFNNAGTFGPTGSPESVDVDQWRHCLEVNVTGAFLCAQQAFAAMRAQQPPGGRIINNGSISAHSPRPGAAAYTTSKHAMSGLTASLALDGRDLGICVSQIDIGNAATDLTAQMDQALQPDGTRRPEPTFDARHVADLVLAIARLPLTVSVPVMTVIATGMPYHGRG